MDSPSSEPSVRPSSDDDVVERIAGRLAEMTPRPQDPTDSPYLRDRLRTLQESYSQNPRFAPGDLVRWRRGLKNKKRPSENAVAVVIEQLSEPSYDAEDRPSSPYFREPLDLRLGVLDEDEDFLIYMFDSARFELAEPLRSSEPSPRRRKS